MVNTSKAANEFDHDCQHCNYGALTRELVYFKSEWPASAQLDPSHSFTYSVRCWLVKSLPIKAALVNVT